MCGRTTHSGPDHVNDAHAPNKDAARTGTGTSVGNALYHLAVQLSSFNDNASLAQRDVH